MGRPSLNRRRPCSLPAASFRLGIDRRGLILQCGILAAADFVVVKHGIERSEHYVGGVRRRRRQGREIAYFDFLGLIRGVGRKRRRTSPARILRTGSVLAQRICNAGAWASRHLRPCLNSRLAPEVSNQLCVTLQACSQEPW